VHRLSPDAQDEIAGAVLQLAGSENGLEEIDALDLPAVLEGLDQAERREFASREQVKAVFRRFGP